MPMPLSKETREKIIYHKKEGEKNAEIAKWLRITTRSVEKIWKLYKEQKTVEPRPHNKGRKPAFCEKKLEKIAERIKEQPDITLQELIDEFKLPISVSALCRKLIKRDLTLKKRLCSVKNSCVPTCNGCVESGSGISRILM